MQHYKKLDVLEFGSTLITSLDLDPVYVLLNDSDMDTDQLKRWLVSYWCFYSVGLSCYLSEREGKNYWDTLLEASRNITDSPIGTWPRGKERRHFRGNLSDTSVCQLIDDYDTPEDIVKYFTMRRKSEVLTQHRVSERVKTHYGFGDWIAFKICDMLERCMDIPITFCLEDVFMFKDPTKAALMLYKELCPEDEDKPQKQMVKYSVDYILEHLGDRKSPPKMDRLINLQEVETILCKWKSHMNGHYPIHNDLKEIKEGLIKWCKYSPTARQMNKTLKELLR